MVSGDRSAQRFEGPAQPADLLVELGMDPPGLVDDLWTRLADEVAVRKLSGVSLPIVGELIDLAPESRTLGAEIEDPFQRYPEFKPRGHGAGDRTSTFDRPHFLNAVQPRQGFHGVVVVREGRARRVVVREIE